MWANGQLLNCEFTVSPVEHLIEIHNYNIILPDIKNIDIKLLNKCSSDTKVDSDGKITEDLMLIIEEFFIDHVDLKNKLDKISVFKDVHNTVHRTFNYITFNGTFKIKIKNNLLYTEWMASHL